MKNYIKKLFLFSICCFLIFSIQTVANCESVVAYKIGDVEKRTEVSSDLTPDGLNYVGNARVTILTKANVITFLNEQGKISNEEKNIGDIISEVAVKKLKDDDYKCYIDLNFSFPKGNIGISSGCKIEFEVTPDILEKIKGDKKGQDEVINAAVSSLVEQCKENSVKENYEYQYLFKYQFEEALTSFGSLVLKDFVNQVEFLINNYAKIESDIKEQGGIDNYLKHQNK